MPDRARQYEQVFSRNPTPMWVFDRETLAFLAVNDAAVARYGWSRAEFLGMTLREIRDAAAVPALLAAHGRPRLEGPLRGGVHRHRTKDGAALDVEIVADDVDWDGRPARLVLATDVTERERTAAALRASEARLAGIVDSAMDAVISVDAAQRVVVFNRAAESIFGVAADEAIGAPLERFLPERYRAAHGRHVETFGRTGATARSMGHPGAVTGRRADGTEFPVEATISHTAVRGADGREERLYTVILRDVSTRDLLAEQLRQAQKMEAVGRLAGGVAHDFNNLLTAISGNADFVLAELAPDTQARADVEEIRRAAERASGLTRQLLAFSRKQVLRPRVVELNDVVEGMERLLRRVIGEDVRLVTRCEAAPSRVFADPGQLEQVLMNLVLNARDAMPEGGTIRVATASVDVSALPVTAVRPGTAADGAVLLVVADDGAGMDADTQARAFEPFFTTKPEGKGTGLGLATVHGIVEQSGGAVWLDSAVGGGTTVSVALPAYAEAPVDADGASARPRGARGAVPLGTVLLVEDEPAVRTLAERMLEKAGYRVVTAANGREGLARWVEERGRLGGVDIIVSDVVMPDAGGRQLVQRVREERPDVPVLFVSGYVEGGLAASDMGGRTAFLEKPFRQDDLLARVRELLRRP
ncbi:PAS domain S-box protein [Roseisolibacter sp. H3M3-2]|uniref:hybrid sensor histidine kinase/response regulator n=1 Tax=Roseisolibacter sp. H3M3-2 TaxID=3031323 RepID=UPI0023DC2D2D|nr:PAS domain S-box protein [Roseisolibacter sp. H3M3-2]MDF1504003.1 PAS domain S-box protein [Roseisolibacter sp. H3M3-2]